MMERLIDYLTRIFLSKEYIQRDQIEWCHYLLETKLLQIFSFLILMIGWLKYQI